MNPHLLRAIKTRYLIERKTGEACRPHLFYKSTNILVMIVVFMPGVLATAKIFFWVFIEGSLATGGAKVIRLALVL
jgi:hypothetical protein